MSDYKPHLSIDHWLEKLELLVYKPFFKDYKGVEEILWMSERDLKNIGVNNGGHRARLSSSMAILKDKLEKMSRHNHSSPTTNRDNLFVKNSSITPSISPIRHVDFERSQTGVRSWPSTKPSTLQNSKHSSPRSSMDGYLATEATTVQLKKALERELSLDSSDLRSHAWYHGTILRQRAEELVTCDGDFLVRDCISQPGDFVITCKWKGLPLHFIIKKIILQPDTVYERIQYCFEKEHFDTIPDFITYYVGSKYPLSESSGVIISQPVNRVMPLSYYESRYGVQCQIHYVAKALEKIPSTIPSSSNSEVSPLSSDIRTLKNAISPKQLLPVFEENKPENIKKNSNFQSKESEKKSLAHQSSNLIRVGSDPMLNLITEKRTVEPRPNSGFFNSESMVPTSLKSEDKPPPKPSRVPSKRCAQRPIIIKRDNKSLDIPSPDSPVCQPFFRRQTSETRFSFLDRPSVSSESSTPDFESSNTSFTIPEIQTSSSFDPQKFQCTLLKKENPPLEGIVLSHIRNILLNHSSKKLACHLTKIDLEVVKSFEDVDLGLGVTSGLEYFLLPQGEQMQKDLMERTEGIKLLVAVLILTAPDEEERIKLLNKWIEIAIETKTTLGNYFGFTSIMLGLMLPEIQGLHSTWSSLRHSYTEIAFIFETKLRPTVKTLHNGNRLKAPNICIPYILSLIIILQQYMCLINDITKETANESSNDVITNVNIPGKNTSDDYGLQLLADHLETGRHIMQQVLVFKKNGRMGLLGTKYDRTVLDIFKTEFHIRLLWGFRGSVVCYNERHKIFNKVVHSLYQKCVAANDV